MAAIKEETIHPAPGFGKGPKNANPIPISNPGPPAGDGSHISTAIRADLGKLGPDKAARVRDVADKR